MSEVVIRRATIDDLPTLVEFNSALAYETEHIQLLPEVIRAGVSAVLQDASLGFYLVSESRSTVCGAMMITTEWSDWRNGHFWWIQSVYVRPEQRQRGIFRGLYLHAEQLAASDARVCGFRLYVEKDNQTAQRTYTSLGMQPTHYGVFEKLKPAVRFRS